MPGLSRVVRRLEALEEENRDLRGRIGRPVLRSSSDDTRANSRELRDASGLLLPPPALREWVAGTSDLDWFLKGGKTGRPDNRLPFGSARHRAGRAGFGA